MEEYKQTEGKMRNDLVLTILTRGVAKVREWSTRIKYKDPNSWKKVPIHKYVEAIERHMLELKDGNYFDDESKLQHADHIACNAMFIQWLVQEQMKQIDSLNMFVPITPDKINITEDTCRIIYASRSED